jgi:hypothetical protein
MPAWLLPAGAGAELRVPRQVSRRLRTAFLLGLPGPRVSLAEPKARAAWWSSLYGKDWVVYANRPFEGTIGVIQGCFSQ